MPVYGEINVRLVGNGEANRVRSKLSANHSSQLNKQIKKQSTKSASIVSMITSKNPLKPLSMNIPVIRELQIAGKIVDSVVQFGVDIYQAHSGEKMLSSNAKALSRTFTSFGANLLKGSLDNYLYTIPTVNRQNLALNYNKELYNLNVYSDKNKLN